MNDLKVPLVIGLIAIASFIVWLVLLRLTNWRRISLVVAAAHQSSQDQIQTEAPYAIVHLVKGTYTILPFLRPQWTRPGSALRRKIIEALGSNIRFEQLEWSTFNSYRARTQGAMSLRRSVVAAAQRWPSARQIIIGHSHGGTLSLQALQAPEVSAHVDSAVCLASPFLQGTKHQDPHAGPDHIELVRILGPLMAIVLFAAIAVLLGHRSLVPNLFWAWLDFSHSPPLLRLTAQLATVVVLLATFWLFKRLYTPVRARVRNMILAAVSPPSMDSDDVLLLRQPGDEAHAWVAGLGLASWFASLLITLVVGPLQWLDRLVNDARRSQNTAFRSLASAPGFVLVVGLVCIGVGAAYAWSVDQLPTLRVGSTLLLLVWMIALMMAACIFGCVYGIVWTLLLVSRALVAAGTGYEYLFAGSGILVSPEPTPPGQWRICSLDIGAGAENQRPVRGRLWHSHLYEDPAALETIADFLCRSRERPANR